MFMPFRQTAALPFWKTLQNMEITIPAGTRTSSGAVTKRTVTRKIGPYLRMGYAQDEETPWITLYRGKSDRKVRYPYDEIQIRGLTDELVFGEIRSFIQGTDNRAYVDQLYSMIELMRPGTLREAAVHYVNEYHRNVSTTRAIFFFEDVDRFTLRDSPYSNSHSYIPCIHMARHATTVRFFHHTYCVPDYIPQMPAKMPSLTRLEVNMNSEAPPVQRLLDEAYGPGVWVKVDADPLMYEGIEVWEKRA